MKNFFALFLCLGLIGCATMQNYNKLKQPEEKILTASIGSTIFRMNKSSDLPNIYGKADMYGGKVDRGYVELKFKGIKENGSLILQIADVSKSSTETTMFYPDFIVKTKYKIYLIDPKNDITAKSQETANKNNALQKWVKGKKSKYRFEIIGGIVIEKYPNWKINKKMDYVYENGNDWENLVL